VRVRRIIAGALLLLAACAAAAAPTGEQRLGQFLDNVRSMRAAFRQVVTDGSGQVVEEARGRLALERPGRFRWDYQQPYERVVLADGKELWLYEADLAQVTVRPLAAGLGETPAALLTGGREALARFEVVSNWSGEQLEWVRLRPRSADSDFDSVAIAFAGERLAEIEIADRLGQVTRVVLDDVRLNPRLADGEFRFVAPAGADVIREGPR
jgi:outer membrane lipoprotein carrier protein